MPDGDKFERRLRGRGWAKAYRLAGGSAEWSVLTDSLITAAAHALRNQTQSPSLSEVASALRESLSFRAPDDSRSSPGIVEAFEQLCNTLDDIEARDRNYVGTQIAIRAAEKVFAEQSRQTVAPEREQIVQRFGEVFIWDLVDQQWLSRVREGICEKNNCTVEQQAAWEEQLKGNVKLQARKLFRSAMSAENVKSVRAPKRTTPAQPLEVQLNEPLVTLDR